MNAKHSNIIKHLCIWIALFTLLTSIGTFTTLTAAAEPDESLPDCITSNVVPDGIYAIKNLASLMWMDVQYNSQYAGYHIQQYAFATTPADGNELFGLFRVTQIESTGRYVIRLLLNENLTFGYNEDEVLTKEIPALDREVAAEDTFEIVHKGGGYYTLQPYGSNEYLCCNNIDASGSAGAPGSYLTNTANNVTNKAKWILQPYQQQLNTGVYWISNDVSIPAGENLRIIDARGPSYAAGTIIQQWRSSTPEPDMYSAQIWIVRHIGCGYYTISHSQKFDMFITYSSSSLTLTECKDSGIEVTDSIQWKIEGNPQNGYSITSKTNSDKSITAPNDQANGLALVYSNPTVSNGGLNRWAFNRIDNTYIASICSATNTSSSMNNAGIESGSAFGDFGHSWIKFENLSTYSVTIGSATVGPNEYITIGGWGNQGEERKQMWYNLERYFASNMTTDRFGNYISILIRSDKLQNASNYIVQYQTKKWTLFNNNCSHMAKAIWSALGENTFSDTIGTPQALFNAISSNVLCVDGIVTTKGEWCGYYRDGILHKVDSGDINDIPTSGTTAQGQQSTDNNYPLDSSNELNSTNKTELLDEATSKDEVLYDADTEYETAADFPIN